MSAEIISVKGISETEVEGPEGVQRELQELKIESDLTASDIMQPENSDGIKGEDLNSGTNSLISASTPEESCANDNNDIKVLARREAVFQTISAYMKLVETKQNHAQMLQEGTICGFLVLCMGDEDVEVAERSFEVFYELSKFPENLPLLRRVNYLTEALRALARNQELSHAIRKEAKKVLAELSHVPKTENKQNQPLSEVSDSKKNTMPSSDTTLHSVSTASNEKINDKPVNLNTTVSTMKRKNKGRETILFLDNNVLQQKIERGKVTQALIGVPGIISVTYDLKKSHCIVRGKRSVAQEDFGRAVARLGLTSVYLIRKNENKEEVKIVIPVDNQENLQAQYPPYPEELEPEEADNSAAVARKDMNPENTSFLKSAKNFIKRSFYW